MNREIKFKFWLGHTNKMTYEHSLIEISNAAWDFTEDIIPLQFTGLKDKIGNDIYEGDILLYDDKEKYTVVYSVGEKKDSITNDHYIGAWMLKCERGYYQLICNVTRPYQYAEIIGNIYETPDLINNHVA